MKIVAADSGAAILDEHFEPTQVVATCAVLVEQPYTKASSCVAKPIFVKAENGYDLVDYELELCVDFLKTVKTDIVHLDISLGSLSLEELSPLSLSQLHVSGKARENILKILPRLRKTATDIKRVYNVDVVAIGKESIPVRVAELTVGAYTVLYSVEKVLKEAKTIRLGLPTKCTAKISGERITLESLMCAEHDLMGYAKDENNILEKVRIIEMPNPFARGFRFLEIMPEI